MIVLIDGVRYRLVIPYNEAALEEAIKSNFQHIFGPDSFYLDVKKLIKSKAGIASIPDGYVILFEPKARWCILEVELASHSIYDHIVPQLTKFNRGIENSSSRKKLVEIFYSIINEDEVLKVKLKQKIKTGEIYKFISDLISENPLIVVAIDKKTDELFEAVRDIRGEVRVLEFQTFRREGIKDQINAYVFEPIFTDREQAKKAIPTSETKQVTRSYRRGSIINAVYGLFDEKGVDRVTYEECETLAKQIKPDTAFNKNHFSWYKRDYRLKREGDIPEKEKSLPVNFRNECIERISSYLGEQFIKDGKVLYGTPDGSSKIICLVSKKYEKKGKERKSYWYGFLSSHREILVKHGHGFAAFGCGSAEEIILMPTEHLVPLLQNMNKTEQGDNFYWHVKIHEENNRFIIEQPLGDEMVDITEYVIK